MWYLLFLYLSCVLVFVGKAIADIVSNSTHWNQSVFSIWGDIESFWGSKDKTYKRKDHDNLILNYLFHNQLVFLTDIWHFANTIRRIGIYSSIVFSILYGYNTTCLCVSDVLWIILSYISLNSLGFHLFYHKVFRKKLIN